MNEMHSLKMDEAIQAAGLAALNKEIMDPDTSFERIEEILAIANSDGAQIVREETHHITSQFDGISDERLSAMMISSEVDGKTKDRIAQYVNFRANPSSE